MEHDFVLWKTALMKGKKIYRPGENICKSKYLAKDFSPVYTKKTQDLTVRNQLNSNKYPIKKTWTHLSPRMAASK